MKIELSKMRKTSPSKLKGSKDGGFKSLTAAGIYDPIEVTSHRSK